MYIKTTTSIRLHQRKSKLDNIHNYKRRHTVYHFACDECGQQFIREASKVPQQRASNTFNHVCSECDVHRFAQKTGVRMRRIYKIDASSTKVKL